MLEQQPLAVRAEYVRQGLGWAKAIFPTFRVLLRYPGIIPLRTTFMLRCNLYAGTRSIPVELLVALN